MHQRKSLLPWIWIILSAPVYGDGTTWCPEDVFAYDRGHPLASARLLPDVRGTDLTSSEIIEEDWRKVNADLVQAFRNHATDRSLDRNDDNLRRFDRKLDEYLAADVPRFNDMEPTYNEISERISWDFRDFSIAYDCSALPADKVGEAIAYFSDALYEYGREGLVPAIELAAGVVEDIYKSHRDRLLNGLPMWPQETWLNGLTIDFESSEPTPAPRRQWVFLRPSVAPALRFSGTDNSELDAAMVVEAFGFINYKRGSEYRKWQGMSAMATITQDNGVGYGAMYRYNSWILGGAYHEKTDDWLLYVSVDLYNLIVPEQERTSNANAFLSRFADHLKGKALEQMNEAAGVDP